jgi:hypothetical protein
MALFSGESVAKKHLDKAERNLDAEKLATSADNLALLIHNGFGGSNPPLSANEAYETEISSAYSRIVPQFWGQIPIKGDQRRFVSRGLWRNSAPFSLRRSSAVPVAPFYIPSRSMVFGECKAIRSSLVGARQLSRCFGRSALDNWWRQADPVSGSPAAAVSFSRCCGLPN